LLDPARFNSLDNFKKRWLIQNEKGAWSRINPYRLEEFKELTRKYILRREKCDVLTNLPPLSRNFTLVEIEDENLKNVYNKTLGLFDNFLNDKSGIVQSTDLLGWLAKLRAITGQAKCQNAIDFAHEFLDSTDDQLTIGINHISVRDTLKYVFQGAGYPCESLSGEDNSYKKNLILNRFKSQDFRLLILNMRSGGEGMNIQNCADALVLERAWNSAEEEQFEGRFHRDGQQKAVTVNYFIARGTIDFFFHELVNKKRNIVGETVTDGWQLTNDNDSLLELSQLVIKNKL
jgi:SNF2 family DNA or RNA helicase